MLGMSRLCHCCNEMPSLAAVCTGPHSCGHQCPASATHLLTHPRTRQEPHPPLTCAPPLFAAVNVMADHAAAGTMAARHIWEVRPHLSEPDLLLLKQLAASTLPGRQHRTAGRQRARSFEVRDTWVTLDERTVAANERTNEQIYSRPVAARHICWCAAVQARPVGAWLACPCTPDAQQVAPPLQCLLLIQLTAPTWFDCMHAPEWLADCCSLFGPCCCSGATLPQSTPAWSPRAFQRTFRHILDQTSSLTRRAASLLADAHTPSSFARRTLSTLHLDWALVGQAQRGSEGMDSARSMPGGWRFGGWRRSFQLDHPGSPSSSPASSSPSAAVAHQAGERRRGLSGGEEEDSVGTGWDLGRKAGAAYGGPQPAFLDMVPWYSGTSADLFKTMFDLMVSLKLFLGRFDMRTMQVRCRVVLCLGVGK